MLSALTLQGKKAYWMKDHNWLKTKHFYAYSCSALQDNDVPIYRAWGLTECGLTLLHQSISFYMCTFSSSLMINNQFQPSIRFIHHLYHLSFVGLWGALSPVNFGYTLKIVTTHCRAQTHTITHYGQFGNDSQPTPRFWTVWGNQRTRC